MWKVWALVVALAGLAGGAGVARAAPGSCRGERLPAAYAGRVERALAAGRDVWGEALLDSASGPTLQGAERYLAPLLFAGHVPGRRSVPLTGSDIYYLPFAEPETAGGPGQVALDLADGSEVISGSVGGRRIRIDVGPTGRERYGSCLARLATPGLLDGYLPVLETRYRDAAGDRYREESFAARVPQTRSLVSFIRLAVDPSGAATARVVVRFVLSDRGLTAAGGRLVRGRDTVIWFSPGARFSGSSLTYVVPGSRRSTIYVAWLDRPAPGEPLALDRGRYLQARAGLVAYWRRRLSAGASFVVPERQVLDAERAKLIQNLIMGWRYSIGNAYEEFEYPESLDAASVMGEYGFGEDERATLETSLAQQPGLYPDWEMGAKLLTSAMYYRLYRDAGYIDAATPILRRYLSDLAGQVAASPLGILHAERWTSDLPEVSYALDSQAVVWEALGAMAQVWRETGHPSLAGQAEALAARLGAGLRTAVSKSERRLPDGSLFIPIKLYSGEQPTAEVLETRDGSYWNYEIPYALASGLFPPGGPQARGALRYLLDHGSLLLGLVRINAYSLYEHPRYPTSGTDDVYLLNLARFLADEEQPGRLVVSLYGQIAAGMTRGTFVSGEAGSVAPIPGQRFRTMYLPPNSVSNAAFLETLRLLLVHELSGGNGTPDGLELAFSTPRAWLDPGKTIRVGAAPTSFGRISYTLRALRGSVEVSLTVPRSPALRLLRLRLRLPGDRPLRAVTLSGSPYAHFDSRTETIDLSGRSGTISLVARY